MRKMLYSVAPYAPPSFTPQIVREVKGKKSEEVENLQEAWEAGWIQVTGVGCGECGAAYSPVDYQAHLPCSGNPGES